MNLLVNKNGELLNNNPSGLDRWTMEQEQPDVWHSTLLILQDMIPSTVFANILV